MGILYGFLVAGGQEVGNSGDGWDGWEAEGAEVKREVRPRKESGRRRAAHETQADWTRKVALQELRRGEGCDPERALNLLKTADWQQGADVVEMIVNAVADVGRTW